MVYNLLLDTKFESGDTNWKFINCEYKEGKLISTNKTFGIEQEIILPNLTTVYLRCKYLVYTHGISKVYIGVQNKDILSVSTSFPRCNVEKTLSVIETTHQEKIKVHIIFDSLQEYNEVSIKEPLLCDLNMFSKTTFLKPILDKTIKYREGHTYSNLLGYNELDASALGLEPAKVGSIYDSLEQLDIEIDAKLTKGKFYLAKIDFTPINDLGKVYFSYGVMVGKVYKNEQAYLLFKATDNTSLCLHIVPTSVLPYKVNLKHLMLIETSMKGFDLEDIPFLPYV